MTNEQLALALDFLAQVQSDETAKANRGIKVRDSLVPRIKAAIATQDYACVAYLMDAAGLNDLTLDNAKAYCARIIPEAVILWATLYDDYGAPCIKVGFMLNGHSDSMDVWVERNGQLYGEY